MVTVKSIIYCGGYPVLATQVIKENGGIDTQLKAVLRALLLIDS